MMKDLEPPMNWTDYEDIAKALYDRLGNDFNWIKMQQLNNEQLRQHVLGLPNFAGSPADGTDEHLGNIFRAWVDEWRNNQRPIDSHLK